MDTAEARRAHDEMIAAYLAQQDVPESSFRCDACEGVFEMVADWDATGEALAAGLTAEEMAKQGGPGVVCDDCFQAMRAALPDFDARYDT